MSGVSDIFHGLFQAGFNITLPRPVFTVVGLMIFMLIVSRGVGVVDVVNRGLMSVKLLAYLILVMIVFPHITVSNIHAGQLVYKTSTLMVMMTSFGFAIIIPTLRVYLNSEFSRLKKVILVGSLLPLLMYLIWIGVVQGLLSRNILINAASSHEPNSVLMNNISLIAHNTVLTSIARLFMSICVVTSFLGVSMCLVDFMADGMGWLKQGWGNFKIYTVAFLPPLIIVLLAPGIFIRALSYAGFFCVFLLILLPLLMLYQGRYYNQGIKNTNNNFILYQSKLCILGLIIIAVILLITQIV